MEPGNEPAHEQSSMRRVARNTAFMLAGEVGVKLLAVVFSVLVVRRLGAEDFGRYSAALAFVAMFSILTDLGTSQFSVRELASRREQPGRLLADVISLRFLLSLAGLVLIPSIALATGEPRQQAVGVFIAGLVLVIYSIGGPFGSLLIARERLDIISAVGVLNQVLFMLLGTVALLLRTGFLGLLAAFVSSQVIAVTTSALLTRRNFAVRLERPEPRRWRPLLRAGLPFFLAQISDISLRRFDVIVILWALSAKDVGWYSVAANLVTVLMPMAQSLGMSLYPSLVRQHVTGEGRMADTVQRAVRYTILASLPISVGGCLLAERIITVLYTADFVDAVPSVRILVWAVPPLFLQEILGRTAASQHLEGDLARIGVVNTVIGLVLIVVGVSFFGIAGAAAAALFSRIFVVGATIALLGPRLVLGGNANGLLRIGAAAAFLGAGVVLLSRLPAIEAAPPAVALAVLIASGAVLYGSAVLLLHGVSLGERRFLIGLASDAFRRLAWRA